MTKKKDNPLTADIEFSSVSGELSLDKFSLIGKIGSFMSIVGDGVLTFKMDFGGEE